MVMIGPDGWRSRGVATRRRHAPRPAGPAPGPGAPRHRRRLPFTPPADLIDFGAPLDLAAGNRADDATAEKRPDRGAGGV